jgi:hypothetical protein
MEKLEPESGGDYGYDLAHEAVRGGRAHPARQGGTSASTHAGGTSDRGEDLAYDEAHDF